MATDLERLVVQLSADIKGYENSLRRAQGITTRQTRAIESSFARANKNIQAGFSGLAKGLAAAFGGGVALRGAQQLLDASTRINNALKVAGLSGSELTKVYDRLFDSAQRNAAPLESLVTLYGRAATVQKELGVSTEELLRFTDNVAVALRVAGTDAQSASGALLQLSQALGSGTVRAEEFNSILEGALPIAQAAAAGLEEAGGSVAKLRSLVIDGAVSSEAFFRAFEAGSVILQDKVANSTLTVSQGFTRVSNALVDAAGRMDEGSGASQALADSLNALAQAINSFDVSIISNELGAMSRDLGRTIDDLNRWADAYGRVKAALGQGDFSGALDAAGGFFVDPNAPAGPADPNVAGGKAGRLSNTAIQSRIDSAFGSSSTSPYVKTVSLSDFAPAAAAANASGAAASKATDAWKGLRKATVDYSDAQREAEQEARAFESIAQGVGSSLASAFSDGKLELQELLGILGQVASQLLQMGSGGIGGGFLSGILGSIFHQGGVVGSGGPKRSVHPAVFAGAPRMHSGGVAGLRSGEVPAILQKGEVVLPKGMGGRASQPQQITITLVGEEGELFTPRVTQISGQTAGVVVRESRPQLSRDAVNSVQQASRNRPGMFRT